MILFTYDAVAKKNFVKVSVEGKPEINPTMIKIEDTSNEAILKVCQTWMDAFGLTSTEYRVNVQLH